MKRREIIALIGGAAVVSAGAAAQQPGPLRRIGVLVDGAAPHPLVAALRRDLAALGHVEGRTIAFEERYAEGKAELAARYAAELVRLRVDVIVAHFTPAVRAAKEATRTIPIVMAPAGAPVETGLVASLARPGGNVTGVSNLSAEIGGKRLQVLKDIIPNLTRVAVLASSTDLFTRPFLRDFQEAAPAAGIRIEQVMVGGPDEFAAAFASMARAGAQAVVIQGAFNSHRKQIVELAARHRLPVMAFDREMIELGGLVSLTAKTPEIYRRAAVLVDRILKGAKPADLPVEQPATFELVLNLKTARALGLTIPQPILLTADEVIE